MTVADQPSRPECGAFAERSEETNGSTPIA
jgi:hypothetical protein